MARDVSGDSELWVLDVGPGTLTQLTNSPEPEEQVTVSADGLSAYAYRGTNGTMWQFAIDGSGETLVSRTGVARLDFHPTSGTLTSGAAGLTVAPIDGSADVVITNPPAGAVDRHPRWSRDGTQVAFTRGGGAFGRELWVAAADGSGARKIGDSVLGLSGLGWHPSGTSVAAVVPHPGVGVSRGDIYDFRTDGSGATQLTAVFSAILPQWSPDGTALAFKNGDNFARFVWAIARPDGTAREIDRGRDLRWSPDSSSLAYCQQGTSGSTLGLAVVHRDGTGLRLIVPGSNECGIDSFAWVP